jgi:hypothetical protein
MVTTHRDEKFGRGSADANVARAEQDLVDLGGSGCGLPMVVIAACQQQPILGRGIQRDERSVGIFLLNATIELPRGIPDSLQGIHPTSVTAWPGCLHLPHLQGLAIGGKTGLRIIESQRTEPTIIEGHGIPGGGQRLQQRECFLRPVELDECVNALPAQRPRVLLSHRRLHTPLQVLADGHQLVVKLPDGEAVYLGRRP